jgi:hypothetical protein
VISRFALQERARHSLPRAESSGSPAWGLGLAFLLLVVLVALSLRGDYHASAQSLCTPTLQSRIDAAPAGSTLTLPACVFRESVVVSKPLTLDGQGTAEIRGSDVWTAWTGTGPWVSTNTYPDFGTDSNGATWLGQHLEQVFADGNQLTQVASSPTTSQFALDGSRHVVLTLNPAGHTIEVSTRQSWVLTAANNVTVTRMTMKHSAQVAQGHAIGNDGYSGWVLSSSSLSRVHGTIVGLGDPNYFGGGTVGPHVTHNEIFYGGDQGYGSYRSHGAILDYNSIYQNGWGGYDRGWQGGGGKLATSNNTEVAFNESYANNGPGLWWDIFSAGASVHHNRVHDNVVDASQGQIMFEESSNAGIHDNVVWANSPGGIGIYSSSSGGVEIFKNTVFHHLPGDTISVIYDSTRDNFAGRGQNVNVHDNSLLHDVDGGPSNNRGLVWWSNDNTLYNAANNDRGSNNRFWYPNSESATIRFYFNGQITSIAEFARTLGGSGSVYMSQEEASATIARISGSGIGATATPTSTPTSTANSTPTSTPSSTPRPIDPSATPTVTAGPTLPTVTPVPVDTASPVPTSTTTPPPLTPTETPSPVRTVSCRVMVELDGTPGPWRPC